MGLGRAAETSLEVLPKGPTPQPLPLPHFPDRLHAFIWRNWPLVSVERLASVLHTSAKNVSSVADALGLPKRPRITSDQQRRSYITIIKRNWHLLPYSQLLELLGWSAEELAYTLREDDFLYIKLGGLKPNCPELFYSQPTQEITSRSRQIASILKAELNGLDNPREPLFAFVDDLQRAPKRSSNEKKTSDAPRFCYSYFALYGDPLLDGAPDAYPDGYLARLADSGVNGVWLQAVLYKLAPFPWDQTLSTNHEIRLRNLGKLVARARRHGIGIYLYLNEPRAMPRSFFGQHPELKGVTEGGYSTVCSSQPEVREYLTNSVASICRAVPNLAGFFTITASENLTNCWSHGAGTGCPRCDKRRAPEVIAEVNKAFADGIAKAGAKTQLIAWDWGWSNDWAEEAINLLPPSVMLQSVSEWDLPINRGGVASTIGEYSISAIGPGPRARRHWAAARKRGLKVTAKIQAGNTWELSAVPYIPALRNVAQHIVNLRKAGVEGMMLGWTLGGYPSPNLEMVEVVDQIMADPATNDLDDQKLINRALLRLALRRYGKAAAPIAQAWNECSVAFSEFPYSPSVVYSAPLQVGPANLLWPKPTGFAASMVGLPYDDLNGWRAIYPAHTFASQLEKVADGFDSAARTLRKGTEQTLLPQQDRRAVESELRVIEAAAIHFRSVATQSRFVLARKDLIAAKEPEAARSALDRLEQTIRTELTLARRLYTIQQADSRIGFEASNHYYYVPVDLAEKILNCRDLLDRWLPTERKSRLA
jgi:hypothetical protein